jgi:hypothetical protein
MAFTILYTITDGKGDRSTTEVNVPSSITFTNVITFAGQMASLIDDLIGGAITRIGVALLVDLPAGLKASPSALSDVEEGARFQFRTDGGFFTSLRIPTFLEGLINAGSKDVDLTDTAVAAFVNAMEDGIDVDAGAPTVLVAPSDKREEDVTVLESAKEQFLSSRG